MKIKLTASDGHVLDAWRADPAGRPRGAVVVVQEIFGVNSHIRSVADGFAADGYVAIAPALFDRAKKNVELGYTAEDVAVGRELKTASPIGPALLDVAAAIAEGSKAGKVGIVGYCWGGFVTWMASAQLSGLECAVPYYGGGILDNGDIESRCPVMAHFGERDAMIPVEGVKKLAANHAAQKFHIYAADHGFNCDQRGSYDEVAAKLARGRTLEFFRQYVG
jgi:carboxymethylenebutenolidase